MVSLDGFARLRPNIQSFILGWVGTLPFWYLGIWIISRESYIFDDWYIPVVMSVCGSLIHHMVATTSALLCILSISSSNDLRSLKTGVPVRPVKKTKKRFEFSFSVVYSWSCCGFLIFHLFSKVDEGNDVSFSDLIMLDISLLTGLVFMNMLLSVVNQYRVDKLVKKIQSKDLKEEEDQEVTPT